MNDVLPKPFTKEGLLNMLEKHLAHLKKMPEGMELVPNTASTMTGPTSSVANSLKEESPPEQSPSTVSTNWNSPAGPYQGVSPASSTHQTHPQYMTPVNTSGYGMEQSGLQYPSPTTPIGGRPPQGPGPPAQGAMGGHRRQVSEMSGADDLSGDAKRPRMYATTNAAMNQMRRPG